MMKSEVALVARLVRSDPSGPMRHAQAVVSRDVTKRVPLWVVASLLVLMILLAVLDKGTWRWIEIVAAVFLAWMLWSEWLERRQ